MTHSTLIMPGDKGADYVKLTDAIKRYLIDNHCTFVVRYFVPLESTRIGKVITTEEIRWLHARNIAIFLNFEISHTDANRGAGYGTMCGLWMRKHAAALGYPVNCPLFVSVDTDTYPGNITQHRAYVEAFREAVKPYQFGVYGDVDIARAVQGEYFWRANAEGWGKSSPLVPVHIQQGKPLIPPGVDPNTCLKSLPAWLPRIDPPTIIGSTIIKKGRAMFTWNPAGYKDAFLIGAGEIVHLSPTAFGLMQSNGVPHIANDDHSGMLETVLYHTGRTINDLTP